MKFNIVLTFLAVALSALLSFSIYTIANGDNKLTLAIVSFIFLSISNVLLLGIKGAHERSSANIKIVSCIFSIIAFVTNLIFAFLNTGSTPLIIINSIAIVLLILLVYVLNASKM